MLQTNKTVQIYYINIRLLLTVIA